jgi:7-cyano-7-deazaguanine synthase
MALYAARGHQLTAVTIDYGQRHRREIQAAAEVAAFYGADYVVVDLSGLAAVLTGSALTDPNVDMPLGHYALPSMAATVVPNRNAILANVAVGVAVARKADIVALGVHAGDHPIYPDCRPDFIAALNACVEKATAGYHTPRVEAPFAYATKTEIAALAHRLDAPVELIWSCCQGAALHCGRCGTCVERREAFADAALYDPTPYEHTAA